MKSWLFVPLIVASGLVNSAIAQQAPGCTSYWVNPKTQEEECFDGNLLPTAPPVAPPASGRPATAPPTRPVVRENPNQEPLNYLRLIREAQSTYGQKFGRFTAYLQDLDRALRAGQLRPAITDPNHPFQTFKTIPGTTANYSYQIHSVTSLQKQNQIYLVYWIGATTRKADRYSYVSIVLSTAEKSSRSDTYVVCKAQSLRAKIPDNFLVVSAQDLAALIQQTEAFQSRFNQLADPSAAEQAQALQEMEQLMKRVMVLLQCPTGFQEVTT